MSKTDSRRENSSKKSADAWAAEFFERGVVRYIAPHLGRTVGSIGREQGLRVPKGGAVSKNFGAAVIRRLLNAGGASSAMRQFKLRQIPVKTVRVSADLHPFEKMSFRAFRRDRLVRETWRTSSFRKETERMFLVVLRAAGRDAPIPRYTVAGAFFWTPTRAELAGMKGEWEMYRSLIKRRGANKLPAESETRYIHVRPHGRGKDDVDPTPGITPVTRKSFWLNRAFLKRIVQRAVPLTASDQLSNRA